ncbi:hypothetical protein FQZ97_1041340 [compost metagenome]
MKTTVSAWLSYSMCSPSPSIHSSSASRFWRKNPGLAAVPYRLPNWLPCGSCRTSIFVPRITMVPLVMTTLPVNTLLCRASS